MEICNSKWHLRKATCCSPSCGVQRAKILRFQKSSLSSAFLPTLWGGGGGVMYGYYNEVILLYVRRKLIVKRCWWTDWWGSRSRREELLFNSCRFVGQLWQKSLVISDVSDGYVIFWLKRNIRVCFQNNAKPKFLFYCVSSNQQPILIEIDQSQPSCIGGESRILQRRESTRPVMAGKHDGCNGGKLRVP